MMPIHVLQKNLSQKLQSARSTELLLLSVFCTIRPANENENENDDTKPIGRAGWPSWPSRLASLYPVCGARLACARVPAGWRYGGVLHLHSQNSIRFRFDLNLPR